MMGAGKCRLFLLLFLMVLLAGPKVLAAAPSASPPPEEDSSLLLQAEILWESEGEGLKDWLLPERRKAFAKLSLCEGWVLEDGIYRYRGNVRAGEEIRFMEGFRLSDRIGKEAENTRFSLQIRALVREQKGKGISRRSRIRVDIYEYETDQTGKRIPFRQGKLTTPGDFVEKRVCFVVGEELKGISRNPLTGDPADLERYACMIMFAAAGLLLWLSGERPTRPGEETKQPVKGKGEEERHDKEASCGRQEGIRHGKGSGLCASPAGVSPSSSHAFCLRLWNLLRRAHQPLLSGRSKNEPGGGV